MVPIISHAHHHSVVKALTIIAIAFRRVGVAMGRLTVPIKVMRWIALILVHQINLGKNFNYIKLLSLPTKFFIHSDVTLANVLTRVLFVMEQRIALMVMMKLIAANQANINVPAIMFAFLNLFSAMDGNTALKAKTSRMSFAHSTPAEHRLDRIRKFSL